MMRRIFTLLMSIFFFCSLAWANQGYDIVLEKGNPEGKTEDLQFCTVTFTLVENSGTYKAKVEIENTSTREALLIFDKTYDEKSLKKNKPKITFDKKYPGTNGIREVAYCKWIGQQMLILTPTQKHDFEINLSSTSATSLAIPFYLAKFDPKKLKNKGSRHIPYVILEERVPRFNIEMEGWSEKDPEYLTMKLSVEKFIASADSAKFCSNKKHSPSHSQQQLPYQQRLDSLKKAIRQVLSDHDDEWMSDEPPYRAYRQLLDTLGKVNLNSGNYDCGAHKAVHKPKQQRQTSTQQPACAYCQLSAQDIWRQLDNIYQQLGTGRIRKDAAVKKAQGLYNCYQKHQKRQKDARYSDKISRFYSRIINY